jgi:hypothetical protein
MGYLRGIASRRSKSHQIPFRSKIVAERLARGGISKPPFGRLQKCEPDLFAETLYWMIGVRANCGRLHTILIRVRPPQSLKQSSARHYHDGVLMAVLREPS